MLQRCAQVLLRFVIPVKRSGSQNHQFTKRLPADLRDRLVGKRLVLPLGDGKTFSYTIPKNGIRFSLRTNDSLEARRRTAEIELFLDGLFTSLRSTQPMSLTRAQAVALSRRAYEAWAEAGAHERTIAVEMMPDPSHPRGYRAVLVPSVEEEEEEQGFKTLTAKLAAAKGAEPEELSALVGPMVKAQLVREFIPDVTEQTWQMLLEAFRSALADGFEHRAKTAAGDFTPDPKRARFPEWTPPKPERKSSDKSTLTLERLVELWWVEAEALGTKPATLQNYKGVFRIFAAFLKHSDAGRVTADDVLRFKDHRLTQPQGKAKKPVSARTVKDHDLAALKSVFGWAVTNRKLETNPAADVTIKRPKVVLSRSKGFSEEEAVTILRASLAIKPTPHEKEKTTALKRWVPWLLAYTGARVGEIVQLRKHDLQRASDHWTITIDPAAGRVKGGVYRTVPLHPHLVEQGFVQFVEEASDGYLFIDVNPKTKSVLGGLDAGNNRVREFVREYVSDPRVHPNHGWRHRFETLGRHHGMREDLQNMITGHRGTTVAAREYGDAAGLFREIQLLPYVQVGPQ